MIQSNDFTTADLGSAEELRFNDILLLHRMYGCGEFSKTRFTRLNTEKLLASR